MRKLTTILLVALITWTSTAQEKNIETESVTIDNLITFIVSHYSKQQDSITSRNITFLIETYAEEFNTEDKVILKQAFKLLSKRLTEDDLVSIVMHSNYNGIAVSQAEATDLKKLLYTIEHPKSSVKTFEEDGVELAYEFVKENFIEEATNAVVMIRTPNRKKEAMASTEKEIKNAKKAKSNAVVITALTLLPELIAVIKD